MLGERGGKGQHGRPRLRVLAGFLGLISIANSSYKWNNITYIRRL